MWDADELMAQMEALKECFNKVMNCLKTHKRFIDHVENFILLSIYMVDHCRGKLMSQEMKQCDGVCRETILNLNMAQSDVDEANDALEVNAEALPSLSAKLLGFSSHDPVRG